MDRQGEKGPKWFGARQSLEVHKADIRSARLFSKCAPESDGCTPKVPRVRNRCTACSCEVQSRIGGIGPKSRSLPPKFRRIANNGQWNVFPAYSMFSVRSSLAGPGVSAAVVFHHGWCLGNRVDDICGLPWILQSLPKRVLMLR